MADWKKQNPKIVQQSFANVDTSINDAVIFGTQSTLAHPERRPTRQVAVGLYQDGETTLPDLQEYSSSRIRWLQDDDSSDEEPSFEPLKQAPYINDASQSRSSSAKLLPRISDPRRPRRAFFSECQSLYDKIKSSCNATTFNTIRRSSYSGIGGDDDETSETTKPSIQGTAILRKGRGEKAQLIDADDFSPSSRDHPIQRVLDLKKPNLTPWSKSKPLTGRPQSSQPRFSKKLATDYGTIDMACIGSKITTDQSSAAESKSQKISQKVRSLRAKSASLVEKST